MVGSDKLSIKFGTRVKAVEALLPNRTVHLPMGSNREIELPGLKGGQGILLRIEATPAKRKLPPVRIWSLPATWKFATDPTNIGVAALVKQASDRRIIDPAGTSHVKKKANVFR